MWRNYIKEVEDRARNFKSGSDRIWLVKETVMQGSEIYSALGGPRLVKLWSSKLSTGEQVRLPCVLQLYDVDYIMLCWLHYALLGMCWKQRLQRRRKQCHLLHHHVNFWYRFCCVLGFSSHDFGPVKKCSGPVKILSNQPRGLLLVFLCVFFG